MNTPRPTQDPPVLPESSPAGRPAVTGKARLEPDTTGVSRRLRAGEIAVIDHPDLDRRHAQALVEARVAAVLNVASSSTGRVPNSGPRLLTQAGIVHVDELGADLGGVRTGDTLSVEGGRVTRGGEVVATGRSLDGVDVLRSLHDTASSAFSTRIDTVVANAAQHLQRQTGEVADGGVAPMLPKTLRGVPVVVVVDANGAKDDLKALKRYIRSSRPRLVGVGSGADLLLDAGHTPDLLVGRLDDLSSRALKACRRVVLVGAENPRVERLEKFGADVQAFAGQSSDEDMALLLVQANQAPLVVLAGGHPTVVELLDSDPSAAGSSFVTRLRLTGILVDAKAIGRLYGTRPSPWPVLGLLVGGIAAVAAAIATTTTGQDWFTSLGDWIGGLL